MRCFIMSLFIDRYTALLIAYIGGHIIGIGCSTLFCISNRRKPGCDAFLPEIDELFGGQNQSSPALSSNSKSDFVISSVFVIITISKIKILFDNKHLTRKCVTQNSLILMCQMILATKLQSVDSWTKHSFFLCFCVARVRLP